MKLELPVRLSFPLYFCVIFIFISGFNSLFDALGLGFWKYIIGAITIMIVMWLLQKSKLPKKEVSIGVGALIIILGFTIGIIFDRLVVNYIN